MSTVDVTPEILSAVAEHLRRRAEARTIGDTGRQLYLAAADTVEAESMREASMLAIKRPESKRPQSATVSRTGEVRLGGEVIGRVERFNTCRISRKGATPCVGWRAFKADGSPLEVAADRFRGFERGYRTREAAVAAVVASQAKPG